MELLPSLTEIDAAANELSGLLPCTPQYRWPLLCDALGTEVWLKHENHTSVGAFKVRGGLVYFADLARREKPAGVISATRGNHGQSVGLAARQHDIKATVVVPRGNSIEKNATMRALGVSLVEHGSDFQEAREFAESLSTTHSLHMVESFHPLLVRGVASYATEFFRAVQGMDVVYVPIGLGSGICGMIAARNALNENTSIVGVVSSHARAYARSLAAGTPLDSPTSTILGDGMACRTPHPEALDVLRGNVDRIVEVSDDELAAAMRTIYECTHNVSEGAGAAAIAAALQERRRVRGKRVGAVLSGGNVDRELFSSVLDGRFRFPAHGDSATIARSNERA
ncbi:MAG: threonine dehydratase [Gammaproteobacteria bacterium]|nr:threonine dehydratase [Gammaproteobacteria bacterium]